MGLLHLISSRKDKIDIMLEKEVVAIPYEAITLPDGTGPIRLPLSQIGGRLVAQISAHLLQNDAHGKGILLGGNAGVPPAEVVIVGAGVAGTYAARAFVGMGAHVTVLDTNFEALRQIYDAFPGVVTMISNEHNLARTTAYADVVVACIMVPNDRPPQIITRSMVRSMRPRSLIMDVSIDEGGGVETSRPTTHEQPTFVEEGIVHYCVPNIPSIVARTSTYAFLNAAFPYILEIANKGVDQAISDNPAIEAGTVLYRGEERRLARIKANIIQGE
jgi:alanine dehydrogenase